MIALFSTAYILFNVNFFIMVTLKRLNELGFPCSNCIFCRPSLLESVDDNEFEDYYKDNLCLFSVDYAFPCQYRDAGLYLESNQNFDLDF